MNVRKGFTLIELLIVVAIIAILAAIAVPNFLEAQTRAKVSRSLNDLRTQATALEAYYVDWNSYTRDSDSSLDLLGVGAAAFDPSQPAFHESANGALQLTTPVAYMSSLLRDPFVTQVTAAGAGAVGYRIGSGSWSYDNSPPTSQDLQGSIQVFEATGKTGAFVVIGVGPDGNRTRMAYKCFPFMPASEANEVQAGPSVELHSTRGQPRSYMEYDPTNGTISIGDHYRFGGSWNEGHFLLNGKEVGRSPGVAGVW